LLLTFNPLCVAAYALFRFEIVVNRVFEEVVVLVHLRVAAMRQLLIPAGFPNVALISAFVLNEFVNPGILVPLKNRFFLVY